MLKSILTFTVSSWYVLEFQKTILTKSREIVVWSIEPQETQCLRYFTFIYINRNSIWVRHQMWKHASTSRMKVNPYWRYCSLTKSQSQLRSGRKKNRPYICKRKDVSVNLRVTRCLRFETTAFRRYWKNELLGKSVRETIRHQRLWGRGLYLLFRTNRNWEKRLWLWKGKLEWTNGGERQRGLSIRVSWQQLRLTAVSECLQCWRLRKTLLMSVGCCNSKAIII